MSEIVIVQYFLVHDPVSFFSSVVRDCLGQKEKRYDKTLLFLLYNSFSYDTI